MLKDITLGQYFPGTTVIHKLDPRAKLIFMLVYIISLFMAEGALTYLFMFFVLLTIIAVSKIKPKALLKGLKPLFIIIIITFVLNMFLIRGEPVLFQWHFITISVQGVRTAVFMSVRLVMLIMCTFMLTYTTSPIVLTDGLEKMFSPLKKIRLPVHEFALMMSIALRFIPTLIEETDKIMCAQKSRGADFDTGGIVKKAKSLIPLIVPLFISAFRRADELATAMESRCYHGGHGRTRMTSLKLKARDYITFALCAALIAIVLLLNNIVFF